MPRIPEQTGSISVGEGKPKGTSLSRRDFIKTLRNLGLVATVASVAEACGTPLTSPDVTNTPSPLTETAPAATLMTKDFVRQSLESWHTFHNGTTNVVMTGDAIPFMDPTDATGTRPYLTEVKNPDGTTDTFAFTTVPIRATGATGLQKDYSMPAMVRQDGTAFGLFQLTGTDPKTELFLVESRATDGSLTLEPWTFSIIHNDNGTFTYLKVAPDGTVTSLKGIQANPALPSPETNVYNAVFHVRGVTVAPTLAPEATAKPTETSDPNMPDGATGKDAQGNYIKIVTENGKQATYVWKDIQVSRETKVIGWFTSHIINGSLDGGIPLQDDGTIKLMPFSFDFQEGVSGPDLRHTDAVGKAPPGPNFNLIFYARLMEAYYKKALLKISAEDSVSFWPLLQNGQVSIPFTSRSGDFVWTPGPDIGYKVYAVPWEDADPATYPGFYETNDQLEYKRLQYRWSLSVDAAGNLVSVIALKDPNALTKLQFYGWFLHPMELILIDYGLPPGLRLADGEKDWHFMTYPSDLVEGAYKFGPEPYFQIVPAP